MWSSVRERDIPIGDDEFVRLRLSGKLVEAKSRARAVHDALGPSRSRLQWLMLHKCSQYLIDHYLALSNRTPH